MAKQFSAEYFKQFQFFYGVVEDRNDPEKLGRVRVRAFGVHTGKREDIPTKDLPWAMPIMPYTSASISGIGYSPTGPVEGTWVFGFFADGNQMQTPMIMGTLIGQPEAYNEKGFNDPNKVYPKIDVPGESDVNRIARGRDINASTLDNSTRPGENTLAHKIANRVTDVKIAVPPGGEGEPGAGDGKPSSVKDGAPAGKDPGLYFARSTWNEPNPRYGGQTEGSKAALNIHKVRNDNAQPSHGLDSKYPLNHTHTTESGHVFEVDDSPQAERIHQYHTSGTFTEIQPNGTRVTKIVGDDYEMVMHDKNLSVWGNVNITVNKSDLRLYVTKDSAKDEGGDLYIETDGDFNLNVKGDMNTKVQGSNHLEVISDMSTNVNGKQSLRVGKDRITNIGESTDPPELADTYGHIEDIVGFHRLNISKNRNTKIQGEDFGYVNLKYTRFVSDHVAISSTNKTINLTASANVNIHTTTSDVNIDSQSGKIDMDASGNVELTSGAKVDIDASNNVEITSSAAKVDIDGQDNVEITSQETVDIKGKHVHADHVEPHGHPVSNLIHHHDD